MFRMLRWCVGLFAICLALAVHAEDFDAMIRDEIIRERGDTAAFEEIKRTAERGDAVAQYRLGVTYFGVKNSEGAVKWLRKAAEQGNVDAQVTLGGICSNWAKLSKKYAEETEKWYRKAAEQGNTGAQASLGLMLYDSSRQGDKEEAAKWLRKAADQGNRLARSRLEDIDKNNKR